LIGRIAEGDANALGELYDESSSVAFGIIRHILQDEAAAEDALVETYVRVRDRARAAEPQRDAVAWLLDLARRAALDRRSDAARSTGAQPYPPLPAAAAPSMARFEPEHHERPHVVRGALERLTTRQPAVIQMTYFGGLDLREVADELKLSREDVLSEIRRAMAALRNSLEWVAAD
jgi:RNA polymerase sigma-70 factor (ECF subfamily)